MEIIFNPGFIAAEKPLFAVLSIITVLMIAAIFYLGIKENRKNDHK